MRQLRPDVLAAIRDGAALCERCLGQGALRREATPDFPGDNGWAWRETCPRCRGTGLDWGRPREVRSDA